MEDRAHKRELGAEQPVGALGGAQRMGSLERVAAVNAVHGVVLRVTGMEEPQHPLETPGGIRRRRELARIVLIARPAILGVNREPRGHAHRVGAAFKRVHASPEAAGLQPVVGADPAEVRPRDSSSIFFMFGWSRC